MCGIAALFDPSLPVERLRTIASTMVERLRHRGPDGSGVWLASDTPLALAHCRLAIRGLGAQGAQPMHDGLGRGVLTFNGELFGVEPVRHELERTGAQFRGSSDTEVLAEALARWGIEKTLRVLHGQYAFAWWDRQQRVLHLARDPIGIRPLYYATAGLRFAVSSEQKGLAELSWLERRPNVSVMLRYLLMGRTDEVPGECLVAAIRVLPAGHRLEWDGQRAVLTRFHRIPVDVPATTVQDVRRELERSVTEQLVSDVTVGAMVSGGLDSSAVVMFADAARVEAGTRDPLHLFAYHDDLAVSDEREFQRAVIANVASPTVVHWVSSSPERLRDEFDTYVAHQEEPYGDVSSYAEFCVARRAKEHGVKVLLSGLGGDEVFLGYPAFLGPAALDLVRARRVSTLMELRGSLAAVAGDSGLRFRLLPAAAYHALPAALRNGATALRSSSGIGLGPRARLHGLLDASRTWHPHDGCQRANAAQRGSIESWCIPRYVLHSDRMTLAHGVEGRVPLLDVRLLEVAFGLPVSQRVGARGLKEGLRAAAADVLPRPVRDRRWKQGFHAPLAAYVAALDDVLRTRAESASRALESPLDWQRLPAHARWRWGNLGAYLQWFGMDS